MQNQTKSVLLNVSAGSDIQYVGPEILIPGLDPIKQSSIVDFSQINFRAEVAQVVTIGATLYTPTASTRYMLTIGDNRRRANGLSEEAFKYSYTTPVDITTLGATPALQREAIHLALIADINAKTANYVNAVSLLSGNGFTITDDAGYFPVPNQNVTNREGASTVLLLTDADGRGFAITNLVLTTAAVISSGVGANLLASVPVFDLVYNNLISGYVFGPKTIAGASAVSGQRYNMFSITYSQDVNLPSIGHGYTGFSVKTAQVWVDNGAGASVANLAGYISLERRMHRGVAYQYNSNPSAQVDFLDNVILFQGPAGAVPVTTGETKMVSDAKWVFNNIGANLVTVPTPSNTGLVLDQTLTAANGAEYTPSLSTLSPKEFTVGKQDITVFARVQAATIANCAWMVGLRVKAPHNLNFLYSGLAAIGSAAASATVASTFGSLNGTVVTTTTGLTISNAVNYAVQVLVNRAGVVTVKLNDITYPVYSVGTTPLVLPAGMMVVPFFRGVNVGGVAATLVVSEILALPDANVIN